jgi:iron(III) transport system permease protein
VFPLALPGYVAGASLVFIKVFDDLGTPLVLNVTNMLAPQAYLRVTSIGLEDPIGYVICVLLVAFSIGAMGGSWWFVQRRDYAMVSRGLARRGASYTLAGRARVRVDLARCSCSCSPRTWACWRCRSSKVWSFSILPEQFTWQHYADRLPRRAAHDRQHVPLLRARGAGRRDLRHGDRLHRPAHPAARAANSSTTWSPVALAMPGLVLGIGYLRVFSGIELPFGMGALTASWVIFVLAYSVRRLPYALRSCMAALSQVHPSLEEAAENLGARRGRRVLRIVVPLMAGGILAGFVTSFITAAGEISETILLTSRESLAPMSYGIYLYMQSIAGRGPGAALGVVAVVLIALGTYVSHRLLATGGRR